MQKTYIALTNKKNRLFSSFPFQCVEVLPTQYSIELAGDSGLHLFGRVVGVAEAAAPRGEVIEANLGGHSSQLVFFYFDGI
jgi:hypothetical protein